MSTGEILVGFFAGSALLGFWPVLRYPRFGPHRVGVAVLVVFGSMLASAPLVGLFSPVEGRAGAPAGLMLVVMPTLALMFWAAGCLIRCVQELIAGSVR